MVLMVLIRKTDDSFPYDTLLIMRFGSVNTLDGDHKVDGLN